MTSGFVQDIVLPWLSAFALALLPVLGGYAVALFRRRGLDGVWVEALRGAAGVAYSSLLTSGRSASDRVALVAAATAGAKYLHERVPGLVAARSLDPKAVADIVGSRLRGLLAVDPTVGPAVHLTVRAS